MVRLRNAWVPRANRQRAVRRRELHRIADQVPRDLQQATVVALDVVAAAAARLDGHPRR